MTRCCPPGHDRFGLKVKVLQAGPVNSPEALSLQGTQDLPFEGASPLHVCLGHFKYWPFLRLQLRCTAVLGTQLLSFCGPVPCSGEMSASPRHQGGWPQHCHQGKVLVPNKAAKPTRAPHSMAGPIAQPPNRITFAKTSDFQKC